jgi:hypothetical protein
MIRGARENGPFAFFRPGPKRRAERFGTDCGTTLA